MKLYIKLLISLYFIMIIGCSSTSKYVIPPNGGASIFVNEPMWISGVKVKELVYSKYFPKAEENNYLKVINAGYWLMNTNGKISQLVYSFELNNKKVFLHSKVYTRSLFSNPIDKERPIIYEGFLDNSVGSIKITHSVVENVKFNIEYNMSFEVYSDSNRTNLITKINQKIISAADNTSGCIVLTDKYKEEKLNFIPNASGKITPIDKLIIACERRT